MTEAGAQLVPDPASPLYRVTSFKSVPNVLYAMTRRAFPGAAAANLQPGSFAGAAGRAQRAEFAKQLGIELANTIWLDPEGAGEVVLRSEKDRGQGAEDWETRVRGASGIVTDGLNLFLCTLYNDNAVVMLFDPFCYGIGLVNISMSKISAEALGKVVELLSQQTGAEPAKMQALIGPCIGPCCRTFPNPGAVGTRTLSNLWDLTRGALMEAGLNRNQVFNTRVCTACMDTEFFSREVDGAGGGAGAMAFGIRDTGSLRAQLGARRAAQIQRRQQAAAAPQEVSLTLEERRLNRLMRCPLGQKKVYIRSVLDGSSGGASKPVIALRCAVMEHVGQAAGGYNIVQKDYIEKVCCGDYVRCKAYQEFLRRQGRQ
jgi:copper oxidase (laccase) domain-containing protein